MFQFKSLQDDNNGKFCGFVFPDSDNIHFILSFLSFVSFSLEQSLHEPFSTRAMIWEKMCRQKAFLLTDCLSGMKDDPFSMISWVLEFHLLKG